MNEPIILIDEYEVTSFISGKESGHELLSEILPPAFKMIVNHLAKAIMISYTNSNVKDPSFLRIKIEAHAQKRTDI